MKSSASSKKRKQKGDFLAYFRSFLMKKDPKWKMVYAHFEKFTKGKCTFGEVNVDLCRKFREPAQIPQEETGAQFGCRVLLNFPGPLKIAYRDKMIRETSTTSSRSEESIPDCRRIGAVGNTPCEIPVLKAASLFACLGGLRISDISKLDWKHIVPAQDGGYCMRFRTEKGKQA